MLLGLVSDTHDNVAAAAAAAERFDDLGVETVIHAGDVIAPPTLSAFEGHELHLVLGNNDGEVTGLAAGVEDLGDGSSLHGRFADLTLNGRDVAALHGESLAEVEAVAAGDYDIVVYGHHHERDERRVAGTLLVNPGAHYPGVPDSEHSVAVYDTDADAVEFHRVG